MRPPAAGADPSPLQSGTVAGTTAAHYQARAAGGAQSEIYLLSTGGRRCGSILVLLGQLPAQDAHNSSIYSMHLWWNHFFSIETRVCHSFFTSTNTGTFCTTSTSALVLLQVVLIVLVVLTVLILIVLVVVIIVLVATSTSTFSATISSINNITTSNTVATSKNESVILLFLCAFVPFCVCILYTASAKCGFC